MSDEHVDNEICLHRSGRKLPGLNSQTPPWPLPIANPSSAAAMRYPQAFAQALPDMVEEQHDDSMDSFLQHGDDEIGQTWSQLYKNNGVPGILNTTAGVFRIGNSFALGFVLGFVVAIWIHRVLSGF